MLNGALFVDHRRSYRIHKVIHRPSLMQIICRGAKHNRRVDPNQFIKGVHPKLHPASAAMRISLRQMKCSIELGFFEAVNIPPECPARFGEMLTVMYRH